MRSRLALFFYLSLAIIPFVFAACNSGTTTFPLAVGSPAPTSTNTPITTPQSPTKTFTFTFTPSFTPTPSYSSTNVFTSTNTNTQTSTSTNTNTCTKTVTNSQTVTNTHTVTNTVTCTLTITLTPTAVYKYQSAIGNLTPGSGSGVFNAPSGIAVNQSGSVSLYVADNSNNSVLKYFTGSTQQGSWGIPAPAHGYPSGLATDNSGNVYYADSTNNSIDVYGPTGAAVTQYNSSNGFSFNQPTGIAVDSGGNIYVADTNNDQIQKLNYNVSYNTPTPNVTMTPTIVVTPQIFNSPSTSLNLPQGIAVNNGTVYVSDTLNSRIVTYSATAGTVATTFGSFGSGNGQLNSPLGLATDSSGATIFVADSGNNRIIVFSKTGSYLTQWGEGAVGVGGAGLLKSPEAVAVDSGSSPNIYVVDSGDNLIQIFHNP